MTEIKVSQHDSMEAAIEFINRPENLKPFNDYADAVQAECEQDLDEENLAIFRFWWSGGVIGDMAAWEAIFDKPAYGAIMTATSMGCG